MLIVIRVSEADRMNRRGDVVTRSIGPIELAGVGALNLGENKSKPMKFPVSIYEDEDGMYIGSRNTGTGFNVARGARACRTSHTGHQALSTLTKRSNSSSFVSFGTEQPGARRRNLPAAS